MYLVTQLPAFEAQIEAAVEPFRAAREHLVTIPGVSATAAHVIIAEIGVDMSRFATVGHLRSWAGLCPELHESAGKVMSRRLRHGAPWLKTVLVQCAWAATRNKNNYLHANKSYHPIIYSTPGAFPQGSPPPKKTKTNFLEASYATMSRHITPETGLVYRTQTAAGSGD